MRNLNCKSIAVIKQNRNTHKQTHIVQWNPNKLQNIYTANFHSTKDISNENVIYLSYDNKD